MNIYIYELEDKKGLYKLGQTTRDVEERIKEQVGHLPIKYNILYKENIEGLTDHDILNYLKEKGIISSFRNEWFKCDYNELIEAIKVCKERVKSVSKNRILGILISLFIPLVRVKINLRSKHQLFIKLLLSPYYYALEYKNFNKCINKHLLLKLKEELKEDFIGLLNRRKTNILYLILTILILLLVIKCII